MRNDPVDLISAALGVAVLAAAIVLTTAAPRAARVSATCLIPSVRAAAIEVDIAFDRVSTAFDGRTAFPTVPVLLD